LVSVLHLRLIRCRFCWHWAA